jgi:phage gpG-like protein
MANNVEEILKQKLLRAKKTLPKVIANELVNISLDAFKAQAWEGVPWPGRNPKAKRNQGRALLVDTARMKRAIEANPVSDTRINWSNETPYAKIHNDGGVIHQAARSETFSRNRILKGVRKGKFKKGIKQGRGFTFKERAIVIPQRKFMGKGPSVIKRLIDVGRNHFIKEMQ